MEFCLWQGLGEYVRNIPMSWNIPKCKFFISHTFLDKVVLDFNMFCSSMKFIVLYQRNLTLIVTVDPHGSMRYPMYFTHEHS